MADIPSVEAETAVKGTDGGLTSELGYQPVPAHVWAVTQNVEQNEVDRAYVFMALSGDGSYGGQLVGETTVYSNLLIRTAFIRERWLPGNLELDPNAQPTKKIAKRTAVTKVEDVMCILIEHSTTIGRPIALESLYRIVKEFSDGWSRLEIKETYTRLCPEPASRRPGPTGSWEQTSAEYEAELRQKVKASEFRN